MQVEDGWGDIRSEPQTRWVREARATAGFPLALPGRSSPKLQVAEDRTLRADFPAIGWEIVLPHDPDRAVRSTSSAVDVYVALLRMYAREGYPEDGVVRFSAYELMQLLGWLSVSSHRATSKREKPSGRHYKQLTHALTYLAGVRYVRRGSNQVEVKDREDWVEGFSILQHYRLSASSSSHDLSFARLSDRFAELVRGADRTVRFDFDLFATLPPKGASRALYRLLAWMFLVGRESLPLRELYERLGSLQEEYVPSRAQQLLGPAHAALVRHRVLAYEPTYDRDHHGRWHVHYKLADPGFSIPDIDLLARQAMDYGVSECVARDFADTRRARLGEVLAATTLGMIDPQRTLGAMIHHYVKSDYDVAASGKRDAPPDTDAVDTRSSDPYVCWAAEERARRLKDRASIDLVEIDRQARSLMAHHGVRAEPWVHLGYRAMLLNLALEVPPLRTYEMAHLNGFRT